MKRILCAVLLCACGSGGGDDAVDAPPATDAAPATTIDDFLPPLPTPDGTAQRVFAGPITEANAAAELLPGAARQGLAGDVYLRNDRVRFTIQAPWRAIGTLPYGGNVVDGAFLDHDDYLGEVGFSYAGGRSCAHDRVEVVLDGADGGPAVVRAFGHTAINDSGNIAGSIGASFSGLQADREDGFTCATTYTLAPGADVLEIAWTLFNPNDERQSSSLSLMADTGGECESWAPRLGYLKGEIDILGTESTATPYIVVQGQGITYGYLPRLEDPLAQHAIISTAAIQMLFEAEFPSAIISASSRSVRVEGHEGVTRKLDLIVAKDPAAIEAYYRAAIGQATAAVTGTVAFTPGGLPGTGARVAAFLDTNANGTVEDADTIVTYAAVDATGAFDLALAPGAYLLRADLVDVARSAVTPLTVPATPAPVDVGALTLAEPAVYDFSVVDDATGAPIPAKVTVLGRHATIDKRVFLDERRDWVVATTLAAYGTSMPADGDPGDAPLRLPAGGPYRVIATRGPEWTIDSQVITPTAGGAGTIALRLRHVVDTTGYVAIETHQHSEGSADSGTGYENRLRSLLVEGIELFASTDHDYLADYDPLIDGLGLRAWIDAAVGVESTSSAWGHFNAFPLVIDLDHPSHGAPDWANGDAYYDLLPAQLFEAQRAIGARVVQINHPRSGGLSNHMHFFDRSGLVFDWAAHTYDGSRLTEAVPRELLRLPVEEDTFFSDTFDALEVWNGLAGADTVDGDRQVKSYDRNLRDWMNFLSMGKVFTPVGNSDSHTVERNPAGLPRTMVRVADDSVGALTAGVDDEVWTEMTGGRDVVVSNGPMVRVSADAGVSSALGRVVTVTGGVATLTITAQTPSWMGFDTIEVFANATYEQIPEEATVLQPIVCYSTRAAASMGATDPCTLAPLGVRPLTVAVAAGLRQASVTVPLTAAEVASSRAGAIGDDAWVSVRVRGAQGVFPMHTSGLSGEIADALITSMSDDDIAARFAGRGTPAEAITAPVFLDYDGGGYRAPFAP